MLQGRTETFYPSFCLRTQGTTGLGLHTDGVTQPLKTWIEFGFAGLNTAPDKTDIVVTQNLSWDSPSRKALCDSGEP